MSDPGTVAITIDSRASMERVRASFARMPAAAAAAQRRALKKLATWLKRQVLRAAAAASGIAQKWFQTAMRYYVTVTDTGLSVWIGTSEIKAHRLGRVIWTRAMRGTRVGRRQFPNTWSWVGKPDAKTSPAVMSRRGDTRLPLDVERVAIHQQVLERLQGVQAEAITRFERLLIQELNYALHHEASR